MNKQHIAPQIFLRAWPFPQGAGRLMDRFFRDLTFEEEVTTVKTTDGFNLSVMPNELIGRHLYMTGEFDRANVEVLLKHARPGDILLDIGANIGYVSACFLAKVRDSRVIAVEPQPQTVDLLRSNLSQFGARANVAPVAISDQEGDGFLQIDRVNRGASKLVSEGSGQSARVELWTPARLFDTFKPPKVDLVKIDVEGHEEAVFRALQPSLAEFRPRLILFEAHEDQAAPTSIIGGLLTRLGYSVHGIQKKLTRLEFPPVRSSSDCRYNDYIALYRE